MSMKKLGDPLDPYRGPTERESLEACGTTPEEVAALAAAFGFPSGLDEDDLDEETAPRQHPSAGQPLTPRTPTN